MNCNKEAKSLTSWRGSEVSQDNLAAQLMHPAVPPLGSVQTMPPTATQNPYGSV